MQLVSIRTAWSTYEKQWGLYQNKVTPSLASNPMPGHLAHNCKMAYWGLNVSFKLQKSSWIVFVAVISFPGCPGACEGMEQANITIWQITSFSYSSLHAFTTLDVTEAYNSYCKILSVDKIFSKSNE